jgi:hypothetical protein
MLTKKEREEIAKRLNECSLVSIGTLYSAVFGEDVPDSTSYDENVETLFRRMIDLCDTSNMVELPRDKNGEIIYIGDTMHDGFDRKVIVSSIEYKENERNVFVKAHDTKADVIITYSPERLIHKNISKYEQLAEKLETIVYKDVTDGITASRIFEIVNELRELGDDND